MQISSVLLGLLAQSLLALSAPTDNNSTEAAAPAVAKLSSPRQFPSAYGPMGTLGEEYCTECHDACGPSRCCDPTPYCVITTSGECKCEN
ncbi:hypothetical protein VHEMI08305 [[Torrubiella] hemipterigena]|uniref:Uncharacterized protein n=1 Tax=[Torrubiella] hemipterigena TaxID=1531966 RepID=A0A0A1TN06_9HYPO|nr:hypothetical protein VHEMI08305 [[Torrubiella] hemipterigena]